MGYTEGAEVPEDKTPRTSDLHPWINIRHKLPEYMQVCIIHSTVGFVTMAQFGGGSPGKEVFVYDGVWHIADYWMPLPTFPK